jgi:conjugative transposon TraM protein
MKNTKKKRMLLFLCVMSLLISAFAYVGLRIYGPKPKENVSPKSALNTKLPEPKQPAREMNKLELYMQAEKDSVKRKEEILKDPYSVKATVDPNEQKVNDRLDKLYKELNKASDPTPVPKSVKAPAIADTPKTQQAISQPDLEMKQLETMLDKIMEIQYPDRKRDSTKKDNTIHTSVRAVVHETQILQNGSTIKLRLLEDMTVNNQKIPKGSFIFGICAISNERLEVKLSNASYNNQIYPLQLEVYDTDGIAGIYMPGAITRDVTKDGADQAIQNIGMTTLDPSLVAQATSAGIQTAKTLLSRKVKLIRVTAKASHHVLLQNPHSF